MNFHANSYMCLPLAKTTTVYANEKEKPNDEGVGWWSRVKDLLNVVIECGGKRIENKSTEH